MGRADRDTVGGIFQVVKLFFCECVYVCIHWATEAPSPRAPVALSRLVYVKAEVGNSDQRR